jgi:hypothetical protein
MANATAHLLGAVVLVDPAPHTLERTRNGVTRHQFLVPLSGPESLQNGRTDRLYQQVELQRFDVMIPNQGIARGLHGTPEQSFCRWILLFRHGKQN